MSVIPYLETKKCIITPLNHPVDVSELNHPVDVSELNHPVDVSESNHPVDVSVLYLKQPIL